MTISHDKLAERATITQIVMTKPKVEYTYDSRTNKFSMGIETLKELMRRASMTKEQCVEEDDQENQRRIKESTANQALN